MAEAGKAVSCVVCGSERVTSSMIYHSIKLPFMDEVSVSIHREECSDCGVSGDVCDFQEG